MPRKKAKDTKGDFSNTRIAIPQKQDSKMEISNTPVTSINVIQPNNTSPNNAALEHQSTQDEPKKKVGLLLNWNRAIHIDKIIDDALIKELTPIILQMKQENAEPITVGIDSFGGNIAAVESLLGLLRSPDQDGNVISIYTASTNRAYSAAASLLAFGDYAVAFPHSRILYHDVRYSGIEDVTPSKALQTARELERGNVAFSLKLADHIRRRLIWVYIQLWSSFADARKQYASFAKKFDDSFSEVLTREANEKIDLVGFSLALFRKLTSPANNEIAIRALYLLDSWMQIEKIERRLSAKAQNGNMSVDVFKGINELVTEIRRMEDGSEKTTTMPEPEPSVGMDENTRKDIKLLIEVLARRYVTDKNLSLSNNGLDKIAEDFSFIKDINDDQHLSTITNLMIEHDYIFFDRSISKELQEATDKDARDKILAPVYPEARMLWYYMVLICRCLCQGDHLITPRDAQLLGLVDEVLGGGPIKSRREWRKESPDYE